MPQRLRRVSSHGLTLHEMQYDGGFRMSRHAHDDVSLTLVLRGGVEEAAGGRRTRQAAAFDIGIKPFAIDHANQFAPDGARLVTLLVPGLWKASLGEVTAIEGWRWLAGGPALRRFLRLAALLRDDPAALARDLETHAIDLIAALAEDPRTRASQDGGLDRHAVARVRARLLDDPAAGVQTTILARAEGLHPVSLARAFRRHYGESISTCVRRARVRAAARLLADSDLPLAAVAQAAGFADQSHMTRELRVESGLTPRLLRRLQAV